MNHYFAELGLDADADERAVKRAYAARLKLIDVEKDPAAFQALRETFEGALWYARNAAYDAMEEAEETESAIDVESQASVPIASTASQSQVDAVINVVLNNAIAPSIRPDESEPQPPIPKGWASLNNSAHDEYQFNFAVNIVRSTHTVTNRGVAAAMVSGARQKEELASFAAQENFELEVARYIAGETGYTAASILSIADAMGWHDDQLYCRGRLITLDANLAHQVEQKLFAARGLDNLHALKDSRHAAGRTLMGKFRPAIFRLWIFDKDELAEFHNFIDEFRWADFSSFSNAPDPKVIDWWKEHRHTQRITHVKLRMPIAGGVLVGTSSQYWFWLLGWQLSVSAVLATAIIVGVLTGLILLIASMGAEYLWAQYQRRYRRYFQETNGLIYGWLVVVPLTLAFALLQPEMPYWPIPTTLCFVGLFWVSQCVPMKWNIVDITLMGTAAGLPAAWWTYSFFGRPNFLLAYASTQLAIYYTIAASRYALVLLHRESSRARRFGFGYSWLILLAAACAFSISHPAGKDIIHQASRLLWLLSIIWGVAVTSFYVEPLKSFPFFGMLGLSFWLYAIYFETSAPGTDGFATALSASITTLVFFIINRMPSLNARLQR